LNRLGFRIEKRTSTPRVVRFLAPIAAALISLIASAFLIMAAGGDPFEAYEALLVGAFGTVPNLGETMAKASALLLVALGMILAFRSQLANIGGEGQIIMGAIASTWIGLTFFSMPPWLVFLMVLISSFLAGAVWGGIAGWLRAKLQLNEVIVTIMLNYLAIYTLNWLVRGPMRAPGPAGGFPQSEALDQAIWWIRLPGTRLHIGFLLALLLTVAVSFFLFRTPWGYRLRAVGANPDASRYGGINVSGSLILAMLLSGGITGLAGAGEIYGLHHRLLDGISSGYGYTGIVVALLGKLNPYGAVLASIFFAALAVGAEAMKRSVGTPFALVSSIQGLVIMLMLLSDLLVQYRIRKV
jgi:ABC-type uncharacterized transport system permease subunit